MAGSVSQIHARNAALYVKNTAVTYAANVSIDQATKGSIFKVKNITITPPVGEVEKIDLWGSDSLDTLGAGVPVTGTFQHQALVEKSWGEGKVAFTLVFSHDEAGSTTPAGESLEVLFHNAGIDVADTPAFTLYNYGDLLDSGDDRILVGNLIFVFNNGSGIVNVAMASPIVTKMGDIKPTGADGHFEQDCEATCLAQDFAMEKED